MNDSKRVPLSNCLKYNGTYYCPGTVVKMKSRMPDPTGMGDFSWQIDPMIDCGDIRLMKQPITYHIDIYGKEAPDYDRGELIIKTLYWEFVWANNQTKTYFFKPALYPYITHKDCYFVNKPLYPYVFIDKHDVHEKDLIPEYADLEKIHNDKLRFIRGGNHGVSFENAARYIEEIVSPIEWNIKENPLPKDGEVGEVVIGWVIYIIVMLVSTIFNQKVGLWAFWTILWIFMRQIMLNKAGGYSTKD